jgi:S1-C subfamily serine protease
MRPSSSALLAVALASLTAGCGGSSRNDRHTTGSLSAPQTTGAATPSGPLKVVQVAQSSPFDPSAIYARDAPGVVTVISTFPAGGSGLGSGTGGGVAAQGSGFVISTSGEIVTNAHVVTNGTGSSLQRAKAVYVQFPDDNEVPAKIVGTDPNADVALLRIDPSGLPLRSLTLGSSANLVVGSPVATLGTPLGHQGSMSVGVISGTNRAIPSLNGTGAQAFATLGAIQTDAAINHGNSGGPLVGANGAVIGINSQIAPDSSGVSSGIGFAVPVDAVKRSVAQLRAHGSAAYAYLGVLTEDLFPQLAQHLGLGVSHGSMVRSVASGSPAARAGLRGGTTQIQFDVQQYMVGGDVVSKLDGRDLNASFDLAAAVTELSPGQRVTLEVWRGKSKRDLTITLGTRPSGG